MVEKKLSIIILIIFLITISFETESQNQSKADSLKLILHNNKSITISNKLAIYKNIVLASSSPSDILYYADQLLKLAKNNKQIEYIIKAHVFNGIAYRLKGDLDKSLKSLFLSAQIAVNHKEYNLQAEAYLEIANTYHTNDDCNNSLCYQQKAIDIIRIHGTKEQLALNLLNTGFSYYTLDVLDSALLYYNEAEPLFDEINLPIGKAYTIGNRALVFWKKGDVVAGEHDLLKAIELLRPLGDQFGMADYHNQLGRIYFEQKNYKKAIEHTQAALTMALDLDLKEQVRDAALLLSELYTIQKEYKNALEYQTQFIVYKDSIECSDQTKKMANMRTEFEVNLKEKEIDILEKRQRLVKTYIIIAIILLALSLVLILYFCQRLQTVKLINATQQKKHNEDINAMLNKEQTKALQSMVLARDKERKRLAQDLHNHFGSLLATVKVNLNGIDDTTSPKYNTITTLVDQACTDIRNMSHSLNMGITEDFGLIPALKELLEHLEQSGKLQIEFTPSMSDIIMNSEHEILIYRIVQELISNVLKHSKATKISVMLTCFAEEDLINILVHDNGIGFDKDSAQQKSNGMGLSCLREMTILQQGEISIDSSPSGGTTVNIDLPINTETSTL